MAFTYSFEEPITNTHTVYIRNPVLSNSDEGKHITDISNLGGVSISFGYTNQSVFYTTSRISSTDNFERKIGKLVTSGRLTKNLQLNYCFNSKMYKDFFASQKIVKLNLKAIGLDYMHGSNTTFAIREISEKVIEHYLTNNTNKTYMIYNKRIVQASQKVIDLTRTGPMFVNKGK